MQPSALEITAGGFAFAAGHRRTPSVSWPAAPPQPSPSRPGRPAPQPRPAKRPPVGSGEFPSRRADPPPVAPARRVDGYAHL
jgi:hypothetical protein